MAASLRFSSFYLVLFCYISLSEQDGNIQYLRAHVPPAKNRIIGGAEVIPHSIKSQVGLWINNRSAFCGGALISPNFVITAAHCGEVISTVEIVLGAHNISDPRESTRISILGSEVILHKDYVSKFFTNDIALVRLSKSIKFSNYMEPAKLPQKSDSKVTYEGKIPLATGWGLVHDVNFPTTGDLSKVLMSVNLTVITLKECGNYYNDANSTYVTSHNLCTSGYKNRGTCSGDSGGPLFLDGVLIGLTSFGTDLCELCSPSVYTRVADYIDWIANHTDINYY